MSLLIVSSIEGLVEGAKAREMRRNKRDVNRLYRLVVRLLVMAQKDTEVLQALGD